MAIKRRPGLLVAARSMASRCGISCAHRGQLARSSGSPGVAGDQDRLTAFAADPGLVRGEPVSQDGLGQPVHLQPALVDPGQRLAGQARASVAARPTGRPRCRPVAGQAAGRRRNRATGIGSGARNAQIAASWAAAGSSATSRSMVSWMAAASECG